MTQGQIHIEKLGAEIEDDYIDGVLVVWVSKRPKDKIRIVGWYKNARVYREWEAPAVGSKRKKDNYYFNIEAKIDDSVLLPVDERTFEIPKATKEGPGIGRSSIWYAEGEKNKELVKKVMEYILNYNKKGNITEPVMKNKPDVLLKTEIERKPVKKVALYYESH